MKTNKKNLLLQAGWTTMEYVVGAIIIITIVTMAVGAVQEGMTKKAEKLKSDLSN